jgi:hypothetical protein
MILISCRSKILADSNLEPNPELLLCKAISQFIPHLSRVQNAANPPLLHRIQNAFKPRDIKQVKSMTTHDEEEALRNQASSDQSPHPTNDSRNNRKVPVVQPRTPRISWADALSSQTQSKRSFLHKMQNVFNPQIPNLDKGKRKMDKDVQMSIAATITEDDKYGLSVASYTFLNEGVYQGTLTTELDQNGNLVASIKLDNAKSPKETINGLISEEYLKQRGFPMPKNQQSQNILLTVSRPNANKTPTYITAIEYIPSPNLKSNAKHRGTAFPQSSTSVAPPQQHNNNKDLNVISPTPPTTTTTPTLAGARPPSPQLTDPLKNWLDHDKEYNTPGKHDKTSSSVKR